MAGSRHWLRRAPRFGKDYYGGFILVPTYKSQSLMHYRRNI